jgi:hypothetical protein
MLVLSWLSIILSFVKNIKYVLWTSIPILFALFAALINEESVVKIENNSEREDEVKFTIILIFQSLVQTYLMGEITGRYRIL